MICDIRLNLTVTLDVFIVIYSGINIFSRVHRDRSNISVKKSFKHLYTCLNQISLYLRVFLVANAYLPYNEYVAQSLERGFRTNTRISFYPYRTIQRTRHPCT